MSSSTAKKGRPYTGPQCPYCANPAGDWIHEGMVTCPRCDNYFESFVFTPPEPRLHVVPVIAATGPAGANACANHPGNTAVTSCQRCGLFICALCDMNLGTGSYCPACFDRVRAEDQLAPAKTRYRDHAGLARVTVIVAFFMWPLAVLFGALGIYYARKGIAQRREAGDSVVGMYIVMLVAILELLGGLLLIGVMIAGIAGLIK
jgi:hypothetical protein